MLYCAAPKLIRFHTCLLTHHGAEAGRKNNLTTYDVWFFKIYNQKKIKHLEKSENYDHQLEASYTLGILGTYMKHRAKALIHWMTDVHS